MNDFDPLGLFKNLKKLSKLQKLFIGISLLTFFSSIFFPSFYIDRKDYDAYASGWYNLLLGWMGIVIGDYVSLIWLANPIYFFALLFYLNGNRFSILLSLIATLLAYSFSQLTEIVTSESGEMSKITSFELGYKLWVTSFAILFIGTIVELITKRKETINL